ncbi:MAG: phosphoserine phosphatase SerB [Betaproteobacteria bacterium]|nr:phosphoserine phosphatase SerB [Betaproteobacteria bacterium]MBV9361389.1 phosphoserine phosphatase SerB [Betaproteobacteria bacterium]
MNLIVQGPAATAAQAEALAHFAGSAAISPLGPHAWRIRKAAPSDEIAPYCEKTRIDFAFLPEGRKFADLKLLAMDMDSTLITIECIDELGDMAGCKTEIASITAQAMRGELDYPQSLRKRVGLLKGLPESALTRVYEERLRLTPGAEQLIAACRKHNVKLLLVSGGFTFFTGRLKQRLGIDYTISNVLATRDGKLTGELVGEIVDAEAKAKEFSAVVAELGAQRAETAAIGDGANDLKMMALAGTSIAFHAKPVVREQATCAINWSGLDAVLNLFE